MGIMNKVRKLKKNMKSNISTKIDDIYYVEIRDASTSCYPEFDYHEFIIAYAGVWELQSNEDSVILYTGTACLVKSGTARRITSKGDSGKYIRIGVKEFFLSQSESNRQQPEVSCVQLSITQLNHIYQLARKMIEKDIFTEYEDIKTFFGNVFKIWPSEFFDVDVRNMFDYIWKVCAYDYMFYTVDEICSGYPYSRPVLNRQFKTFVGTTVVKYRAAKKMKYARLLLLNTDMNIKDIAGKLNYLGISYFVKQFKNSFGLSPKEYRKKHKKY